MAIRFAGYSGKSANGYKQNKNEDYIAFQELGDDMLFAVVADGSGSGTSLFQPASIVTNNVCRSIKRIYEKDPVLLAENSRLFLEEAILAANDSLIAFKLGNEETNSGFASTFTCVLVGKDGTTTFAHVGNTRLYLIRGGKLTQLTKDQTEGQRMVDAGKISQDDYYKSMEKLSLYNGLGILSNPLVLTQKFRLGPSDILSLTSDGIHYSYRAEGMMEIIFASHSLDEATDKLLETAEEMKSFADNTSVCLIQYLGENARIEDDDDDEDDDYEDDYEDDYDDEEDGEYEK